MTYSYLNNMELDEAIVLYLSKLKGCYSPRVQTLPTAESEGRRTAEAVYAVISSPHYNASAMDGIALSAAKTFGASDTTPVFLEEEQDFVRVDTGDPIPDNCDAVVMTEDLIEAGNGRIKLIAAAAPWQNIRQIGEDLCEKDMILPSATRIDPAAIGALLAGGVLQVPVFTKPLVGIIPTGDEIVLPTDHPAKGSIIEFNSSIFSAMLHQMEADAKVYPIVPDRREQIRHAVVLAAAECDLVLLNAGSSAGREDFSCEVIAELGSVFVHGIAIKPGKPAILGRVENRPVIGVPGYPVSGMIIMEKIVKPVLAAMMNVSPEPAAKIGAVLTRNLVSSLKYREFIRVRLGDVGGQITATPLNRGAAVVTSFVKADGILEIPMNSEGYRAGTRVDVELLRSEQTIHQTLVVTGSHDPLIDIIADIFRKTGTDSYLASSHVGSMGGIQAIRRKEAHLAGIHLLDEETGLYNQSYIEKYLGTGNTMRICGVMRQQGLMVMPGNPKGIASVEDLFDLSKNIRYVNRQKGSGTRILLDYLLRKNGLDGEKLYGYNREEFTHMNVAAIIASGNADAGMGIYSAASSFGLDFIPVCEEQYDFIAPVEFSGLDKIRHLVEVLKSDEFRERLVKAGGYRILDTIGEVEIL